MVHQVALSLTVFIESGWLKCSHTCHSYIFVRWLKHTLPFIGIGLSSWNFLSPTVNLNCLTMNYEFRNNTLWYLKHQCTAINTQQQPAGVLLSDLHSTIQLWSDNALLMRLKTAHSRRATIKSHKRRLEEVTFQTFRMKDSLAKRVANTRNQQVPDEGTSEFQMKEPVSSSWGNSICDWTPAKDKTCTKTSIPTSRWWSRRGVKNLTELLGVTMEDK